jgi:hypothetical protein
MVVSGDTKVRRASRRRATCGTGSTRYDVDLMDCRGLLSIDRLQLIDPERVTSVDVDWR